MARGLPQAPKWAWAVMALATVWLIAMGILIANRPGPPGFTAPASADGDEPTPPVAVFLGDSWGEGTGSDHPGGGLADQVAAAQGWQLINRSQGGTGYVTGAPPEYPERLPLPDRVADVVAAHPDVVMVAAGINDAGRDYTEAQMRDAVERTLRPLREQLPDAAIYVIGPFWANGYPIQSADTINRVVSETAAGLSLPFISPIDEGWITGSNDGTDPGNRVDYIGPDGAHPTQAGHDYLASLINTWVAGVPAG